MSCKGFQRLPKGLTVFKVIELRYLITAKMGYHRLRCDDQVRKNNTSTTVVVTDIVRCGGLKREQWIDNRMSELLPTPYYHLVYLRTN
jgi:hypothetical protein